MFYNPPKLKAKRSDDLNRLQREIYAKQEQAKKRNRVIALVLLTLFLTLFLVFYGQIQEFGYFALQKWKNRSDPLCEVAKKLTICAHRANSMEFQGVKPGSIEAFKVLWKQGIRCFDMDVLQTADNALLVAHPDALETDINKTALNDSRPLRSFIHEVGLNTLRQLGAKEQNYATLDSAMSLFAQLYAEQLNEHGSSKLSDSQQPMFCLELKEAAINKEAVQHVIALVKALKLEGLVVVWMSPSEERYELIEHIKSQVDIKVAAIMQDKKIGKRGQMIYLEPEINQGVLDHFSMFGPSIKLGTEWFKEVRLQNKPTVVWVLDDEAMMLKSLQIGAKAGVSNFPIQYRMFVENFLEENCLQDGKL